MGSVCETKAVYEMRYYSAWRRRLCYLSFLRFTFTGMIRSLFYIRKDEERVDDLCRYIVTAFPNDRTGGNILNRP